MKKKTLYSIQGIIFQEGVAYGTGYKLGVGIAVTIQKAMNFAVCQGIVGPDENKSEVFCGSMNDMWGDSVITDFQLKETELSFNKQYEDRPVISYSFKKKEGNVWLGEYSGDDCGRGQSKCIVTPIDESFFEFK